ncbi:Tsc22 Domain Family Protein 3 [Manis pentadactyla]|nr:Tsc22 Domain Family Protein 3 [Manis pentadactyla]
MALETATRRPLLEGAALCCLTFCRLHTALSQPKQLWSSQACHQPSDPLPKSPHRGQTNTAHDKTGQDKGNTGVFALDSSWNLSEAVWAERLLSLVKSRAQIRPVAVYIEQVHSGANTSVPGPD